MPHPPGSLPAEPGVSASPSATWPEPARPRSSEAPRPAAGSVGAPFLTSWVKRALDVGGALLLSAVALPLLLLVCLLIRLDSPGPALYGRMRLGRHGVPFRCLKLRSMYRDADLRLAALLQDAELRREYEQFHKLRNDPRLTRVGRVLRRLSLDELPQLYNVLAGDMSLVGPRPYDVVERALMGEHAGLIHSARPGLTGLWQVSGRNATSFSERLALDVRYVEQCSLALDLRILARTLPAVLSGHGAY